MSAEELAGHLAAAILFTTPPTDRALAGWHGESWAYEAMAALKIPLSDEDRGVMP